MAIKGKRIMALGSNEEMRELAGPDTRLVDMGNRTVIPGIVNPHFHTFSRASRTYGPEVGLIDESVKLSVITETTAEATAKKIHDTVVNAIQVQNIPPGKWITVLVTDTTIRVSGPGKIVTMDDWSTVPNTPGTIVESMAIKGKRIMALGSNGEMRELAGPDTRIVDMGNRTVIPGIVNPHFHTFSRASRTYGPEVGLIDESVKLSVITETTAEATAKKIHDPLAFDDHR